MKQDEFKFLIIKKDTNQKVVLTFNDLYGYMEPRFKDEKEEDLPDGYTKHEGIHIRMNNMKTPSKDSYIPKEFEGLKISSNTAVAKNGCNDELLIQYISEDFNQEYNPVPLEEFLFKVTDVSGGESVILSIDDLVAFEEGYISRKAQGIFIESNETRDRKLPSEFEGRIFINNNGYFCRGINPSLDIEYVGLPAKGLFSEGGRVKNRIPEMLGVLEMAWKLNPDLRLGQLLTVLVEEKDVFSIEDDELLKKMKDLLKNPG